MDTYSEVSIRIIEAYLSRVNLNAVLGRVPPTREEQGKQLGQLYVAVYKAVKEGDQ